MREDTLHFRNEDSFIFTNLNNDDNVKEVEEWIRKFPTRGLVRWHKHTMALSILVFRIEMVAQSLTRNTKKATLECRRMVNANDVPYYFLINMGGGFVEGEQYQVTIDVNKDAHAHKWP